MTLVLALVCLVLLLSGCALMVGSVEAGPNPGGGYYTSNVNVGLVNR
jgi:uncharacterized protein YceK